jgi:hypothetical protein
MAEKANTISGFCTLETLHNLHKNVRKGRFPPFRGEFWPRDLGWSVAFQHISLPGHWEGGGAQEANYPTC